MFKNTSKTYSCALSEKLKNNFIKNKIYLIYERTYKNNKKEIDEAESLITGVYLNKKFGEGKNENSVIKIPKYIYPEYIGKIKRRGNFQSKYENSTDKFIIKNISVSKGNEYGSSFEDRLKETLHIQESKFNQKDGMNHLIQDTNRFFIEVESTNYIKEKSILYFEKKLYDIVINYDNNGNVIDNKSIEYKRYFKITDNIIFDMQLNTFIKDGKFQYNLGTENKEILYNFLKILIKYNGTRIEKEKIINDFKSYTTKKITGDDLSKYKRQLKDYFNKILKLDKDYSIKFDDIINVVKNQGYLLKKGEYIENYI